MHKYPSAPAIADNFSSCNKLIALDCPLGILPRLAQNAPLSLFCYQVRKTFWTLTVELFMKTNRVIYDSRA